MGLSEVKAIFTSPEASLNGWLAEIEGNWKNIPEFRVDTERLKHLAVICDGNRRAAREKGLNPYYGHRAGVEVIRNIARAARNWDIRTLTFWVWSTENWSREKEQVEFVMRMAERFLPDEEFLGELIKNEVRFKQIGRKDRFSGPIKTTFEELEQRTAGFDRYHLNLAMDYGGLDEIARAIERMFETFRQGEFNPEIIKRTPQVILGFLDTATQVLPDLVVRTGVREGEIPHTSGFMPLQTVYAGWVFLPDLFPDLTPESLLLPIKEFLEYERRGGR